MEILVVGMNYKSAAVELRERVAIASGELEALLQRLASSHTVLECVVLSTCNRTEIYAVASSARAGADYLSAVLAERAGLSRVELSKHLYTYVGQAAVRHAMEVACGLDSMVVGETQILGQVRQAFLTASDLGVTGAWLDQLFRRTLHVGKRAQSETEIGQRAVSVSYAAVQLAQKIYGSLQTRSAMVVGAGKMARLAAQLLMGQVHALYVANRTKERAEALARDVNGIAVAWADVPAHLSEVELVISATGAPTHVLTRDMVETARRSRRRATPLTCVDIALPRDIEPAVKQVRNVFLYDIDDLEGVVEANLQERSRQARLVARMIDEEADGFATWLAEQAVVPLIAAVRERGERIQRDVMASLERKLPELTERERKILQKHTMSIVNQLLHDPVQNMKELATTPGGDQHVRVFAELFGVQDAVEPREGRADSTRGREGRGFTETVRSWTEAVVRDMAPDSDTKGPVSAV
ncbi:MAG: glutamyl-tRNA reductase [Alicyclobacillus sp.]|nr:glutamyl-tRNA reductase [Alicyclobacillus sp.]